MKIRITKVFYFEMAHALTMHDGACKYIHGHSYKLSVTLVGHPKKEINRSDTGMVTDFGVLKQIINEQIIQKTDHALMLYKNDPQATHLKKEAIHQKLILVDYNPTCENMLIDFVERIKPNLPENIQLHSIKLQETPTSIAEWNAGDNYIA